MYEENIYEKSKKMAELLVNNMEVGYVVSTKNGTICFEPYRGMGHYELATTIKQKGQCNAVLIESNRKQDILIYDYPEYGTLKYKEI